MNTDKLIRDRMKDLGLKYERVFNVGEDSFIITTYNQVLKEAYDKKGWPVWIKAGRAEKLLEELEESNGK
ncbi:MAG: hypothetical protein WAO56_00620 [Miniphocaeibacter sp.]